MSSEPALRGKVAVVTGAGRGIGAAVARRLAADGAAVVVHYRNHAAEAKQLVDGLRRADAVARAVRADLTVRDEVTELFDAADTLGGLDIVVNNAAYVEFVTLAAMTDAQVKQSFETNFRGPLYAMQEAERRMRPNGRIVNISTLGTTHPLAGQALYSAGKAAMEQLTLVGAIELAAKGITVNTVCPGATETETFREASPPGLAEIVAESSHFKRIGQPRDIADVIAFLVTEDARWVTGQRIVVSGGAF